MVMREPRTPIPVLRWGKHKIPMTPEEVVGLERRLAEWAETSGGIHGFVRGLLDV